jgi:hypothetical protein
MTIVKRLSKLFCGLRRAWRVHIFSGMSRHTKPKHRPMSVRLRVAQRAVVERVAAQRGIGISTLLREIIEPYLATVDAMVNIQDVTPLISHRPTLAPENRAAKEPAVSRSGFAERTK